VPYMLPASNRFDAEGLFFDQGTAIVVAKYRDYREAELFAVAVDGKPGDKSPPPRSVGRLPGFTEPATGAAPSGDGTLLAVGSYGGTRVDRGGRSDAWEPLAEVRYASQPIEGITWDGRDLILAAEEAQGLYRLREAAWRAAAPRGDRATPKAK